MATREARLIHRECDVDVVDLATDLTTVFTGPCILYSVYVNTVLSADALPIQDGTIAVITLPASTAAGDNFEFPGIRFDTSLIVDPADSATGNITLNYRTVNTIIDPAVIGDVFSVLNSGGITFSPSQIVLDSDGNSFTVTKTVLDSDGNSFGVS